MLTCVVFHVFRSAQSDALLWQILRTNNCFVTKKGEKGDRSDRMRFSKERGNLNGKDSFGNSGLANSKVLSVSMEGKTVKVSNRGKVSLRSSPSLIFFRHEIPSVAHLSSSC